MHVGWGWGREEGEYGLYPWLGKNPSDPLPEAEAAAAHWLSRAPKLAAAFRSPPRSLLPGSPSSAPLPCSCSSAGPSLPSTIPSPASIALPLLPTPPPAAYFALKKSRTVGLAPLPRRHSPPATSLKGDIASPLRPLLLGGAAAAASSASLSSMLQPRAPGPPKLASAAAAAAAAAAAPPLPPPPLDGLRAAPPLLRLTPPLKSLTALLLLLLLLLLL